jgi:hypothetical protein
MWVLIDDRMDESYVAVSILPVSHATLFGIKCPKFRDSVTVGRKVRTLQDKGKTITLSRKVGNQIPSDIGSHLKTDTSTMLWQQTPGYSLFKGAEPTMVVIKLMWFRWTITLRIGEGHVSNHFQGDSFGMTNEKHEKITHNVRFDVHTSVSINQVSGKPTATSSMVENPLKLKAEAEGSFETSKNTYPVIWRRILEDCM